MKYDRFGLYGISTVVEICHGSTGRFGRYRIQRIAQNKLDMGLVAGQAQKLRLLRGNQQVDYLHLLRFSFGVFLFSLTANFGSSMADIASQIVGVPKLCTFCARVRVAQ